MMHTIVKKLHFCYGHRLMDYDGKCARPHGHNGVLEVELSSNELDARGMVYDFADVKTIVTGMGMALMGTGIAEGDGRAETAAKKAINSPLLEDTTIKGARGVLINITGSDNMTLHELSEASRIVQEAAHADANIILGTVSDEAMGNKLKITVIATGFDEDRGQEEEALPGSSLRPRLASMRRPQQDPIAVRDSSSGVPESSGAASEMEVPAFLRQKAIE